MISEKRKKMATFIKREKFKKKKKIGRGAAVNSKWRIFSENEKKKSKIVSKSGNERLIWNWVETWSEADGF